MWGVEMGAGGEGRGGEGGGEFAVVRCESLI